MGNKDSWPVWKRTGLSETHLLEASGSKVREGQKDPDWAVNLQSFIL